MTTDLTPFFVEAIEQSQHWSPDMFPSLLERIARLLQEDAHPEPVNISIDWTQEHWGRVLVDRYGVVIARLDLPLVILLEPYASVLQLPAMVCVSVESFDLRDYRLDSAIMRRVYPGWSWRMAAATPSKFSIIDLWWSTL